MEPTQAHLGGERQLERREARDGVAADPLAGGEHLDLAHAAAEALDAQLGEGEQDARGLGQRAEPVRPLRLDVARAPRAS